MRARGGEILLLQNSALIAAGPLHDLHPHGWHGLQTTAVGESSKGEAQPFSEGTKEKQPEACKEYFLSHVISGEPPSALDTTAGPSCQQLWWDTDVAQGGLICLSLSQEKSHFSSLQLALAHRV